MGEKVGVLKHFKVPEKIPLDPVTIPWTLWRLCLLSPGYKWYSWPSWFPPRPLRGPSPPQAEFLGWGRERLVSPIGIPWGPPDPRPRTQHAAPVRAECFPSDKLWLHEQGARQETASPSAHLALQAARENNKTSPCLMIEITLKVVAMP